MVRLYPRFMALGLVGWKRGKGKGGRGHGREDFGRIARQNGQRQPLTFSHHSTCRQDLWHPYKMSERAHISQAHAHTRTCTAHTCFFSCETVGFSKYIALYASSSSLRTYTASAAGVGQTRVATISKVEHDSPNIFSALPQDFLGRNHTRKSC